MWISKATMAMLTEKTNELREIEAKLSVTLGANFKLETTNIRLRSDLDWFKHRLNQVERERGQLIQAAIGVKISVPEFVPTFEDPREALNEMPDLSSVGEDALDQGPETDADEGSGVDFSMMPGYSGKR